MRVETDELVWELPKGGALYFWVRERVPDCPNRACRRARKCVGAEIMPHRRSLGLPSCRMIEEPLWAMWSECMQRLLTGPPDNLVKDIEAIAEKHCKAARQARRSQA